MTDITANTYFIQALLASIFVAVVAVCAFLDGQRVCGRVMVGLAAVLAFYSAVRWTG